MTAGADNTGTAKSKGRLSRLASAVTGRVVETIDPDSVIDHVDIDHLLERVDVNRLLDRVDLERLLDRIDVNRLLDRVDVDQLVTRIDVDAALESVDLEAALRRAGIPELVAASTEHMAGSALDLARRQLTGLDVVVGRVVARVLRRDPAEQSLGPSRLVPGRSS